MGLDIYAGSLSRYYAGDWKTINQARAESWGMPFHTIHLGKGIENSGLLEALSTQGRPAQPPRRSWWQKLKERFELKERLEPTMEQRLLPWRTQVGQKLGIAPGELWSDLPTLPYATDKPDWEGLGGLILWAAYEENGAVPPEAFRTDWAKDPIVQDAARATQGRYVQILSDAELWLPHDFASVFPFPVPFEPVLQFKIGSCQRLLSELELLNSRTWQASSETLAEWQNGSHDYQSLEGNAKFGFALFHKLATFSVEQKVPLMLDY